MPICPAPCFRMIYKRTAHICDACKAQVKRQAALRRTNGVCRCGKLFPRRTPQEKMCGDCLEARSRENESNRLGDISPARIDRIIELRLAQIKYERQQAFRRSA
jgi:hypothetical protein